MQDTVKNLLAKRFDDAHIEVSIDGSHVNVLVVSSEFEGLRPVKKQQLVYAELSPLIADGTLHAVNMQTLTPSEHAQ